MTREKELLAGIVNKLIDNGVLDEIVAAVLESALDDNLDELEALSDKPYLQAHHWQDYVDSLTAAKAMVRVLRYFTINDYLSEESQLNQYSTKLEAF